MGELEYSGLMDANLEFTNEAGEIIFTMKRKDNYNSLYYLFEKHEDKMSSEDKQKFEMAWDFITMAAALMKIHLYDSNELVDGIRGMAKSILESEEGEHAMEEADKMGERVLVRDIDIKIFDHGTGRIDNLTVGISVPPGGQASHERLLADS